ncbi:SsgA family sporulation/cell division regulator [Streptomyces broussonetiae]|uniref:SsgA family sporulation/cell division regulator n=1 Tax=Streptomyces broussonetiae TaxID=2686304 RepID=A0A6I6MV03_9ACTN|nr:SsgA family sporulation/cell division regulator [Streptomyces broussonetiae]QHA03252.1 SsgA family sporulation/cell division regulator [Streptomyces broussonetiae]
MRQHPARAAQEDLVVLTTTVLATVAGDPPVPLPAELRYTPTDPYAVCLSLGAPAAVPVDWVFARSLLADGVRRPTGSGDVVVLPRHRSRPDTVRVLLRPWHGAAALDVAARDVSDFLHLADALVPPGTEHRHIDLDHVVEQLTAGSE